MKKLAKTMLTITRALKERKFLNVDNDGDTIKVCIITKDNTCVKFIMSGNVTSFNENNEHEGVDLENAFVLRTKENTYTSDELECYD